jgi:hypothetical protein
MAHVQINPFRTSRSHSATDSRYFRFSVKMLSRSAPCWGTKNIFSPAPEHALGDADTDRTDGYATPIQWRTQEFFSGRGGSTNSVEDSGQRERGAVIWYKKFHFI